MAGVAKRGGGRLVVNPLFKHPSKGWLVVRQQDETKSYCICSLYDHQPRTDIKTYVLEYEEIDG